MLGEYDEKYMKSIEIYDCKLWYLRKIWTVWDVNIAFKFTKDCVLCILEESSFKFEHL